MEKTEVLRMTSMVDVLMVDGGAIEKEKIAERPDDGKMRSLVL